MNMKDIAKKGIVEYGNLYRIGKVMNKAKAGEPITVGILGGSITQGALSSSPETCYAYLVYQWWVNKFKNSKVTYVNGGIGGTSSQFGVARVSSDMLSANPDFIITEFSVNDTECELFQETYEGLIRKMLTCECEPAVFILNNVRYNNGVNAQVIHNQIGKAYDLPIVSIKNSLYPEVEAGRVKKSDITPDDLHPNDVGHKLVADIVIYMLEAIYNKVETNDIASFYSIPKGTVTSNRYMDSLRLNNKNITPALDGFVVDTVEQKHITEFFRNGWSAKNVGDRIHFKVTGGMISVQYKKTIKHTAPVAKAVIDGDEEHAIILDANFQETWGDCLYLEDLLIGGEVKEHTLDISIISVDEASDIDFYLVSVIVANRNI